MENSVGNGVGSSVPITTVSTGSKVSGNNVSFDSGRSVVVSGNIKDVVLSSEKQRKNSSFVKNVNDVDVELVKIIGEDNVFLPE